MFRILYFRQVDKCLDAYTRSALGIEKKESRGESARLSRARETKVAVALALRYESFLR